MKKKVRLPVLTIGQLKMFVAIAVVVEWIILASIIGFYESIYYLSSFSAAILKGSFLALSSSVFTSFVFLFVGKGSKEKRMISVTEDDLKTIHGDALNQVIAELQIRIPVLDPKGFVSRVISDFSTACYKRLACKVSYDPSLLVSPVQMIVTVCVLLALFAIGVALVVVRAYGLLPGLLSDEKLYGTTNNLLVGAICMFRYLYSRFFVFKDEI